MENKKQIMKKVTFSIDEKLLAELDAAKIHARYSTRSAAITEAVRQLIEKIGKRGRAAK